MDENHSHIKARLPPLWHREKHGLNGLYEPELCRASDKTVALVRLWSDIKKWGLKMRSQTLDCITFTSKGKIDVRDPVGLDNQNADISSLTAWRETLEGAMKRLSSEVPDFLCDLRKDRDAAEKTIAQAPREINYQLGTELRYFSASSVEAAMKSHHYLEVNEKWDAAANVAKAKLGCVGPKIALVEAQLTACGVLE
jgi:hypothetical protein